LRKEYVLMILAAFIWGSGHPIGKIILREFSPSQLSFLSSVLGGAVLLLWTLLTHRTFRLFEIRGRGLILTLLSGAVMFFLYPNLSFSALRLIPASANSILVASSTIFVALLAVVMLREKLGIRGYLGIIVSFIGIVIVIMSRESQTLNLNELSTVGSALALLAAFASALYAIIGRKLSRYDAVCVTTLGAAFGSILQGLMLLASSSYEQLAHASTTTYALIVYWGIFSGLAYVAYYYCLGKTEAAKVSSFIYLSPIFATILSVSMLGEQITAPFLVGFAFTLGGIWATQTSRSQRSDVSIHVVECEKKI